MFVFQTFQTPKANCKKKIKWSSIGIKPASLKKKNIELSDILLTDTDRNNPIQIQIRCPICI